MAFLEAAQLDWAGFFTFSNEDGTYAAGLDHHVAPELMWERIGEASAAQDEITMAKRDAMVGQTYQVLVDSPGVARSVHEAPEIDGIIEVDASLLPGSFVDVVITESLGTDLVGNEVEKKA